MRQIEAWCDYLEWGDGGDGNVEGDITYDASFQESSWFQGILLSDQFTRWPIQIQELSCLWKCQLFLELWQKRLFLLTIIAYGTDMTSEA